MKTVRSWCLLATVVTLSFFWDNGHNQVEAWSVRPVIIVNSPHMTSFQGKPNSRSHHEWIGNNAGRRIQPSRFIVVTALSLRNQHQDELPLTENESFLDSVLASLTNAVLPLLLTAWISRIFHGVTTSQDELDEEELMPQPSSPKRKGISTRSRPNETGGVGMGRRGTLLTLGASAMGWVASDIVLGPSGAGRILTSMGGSSSMVASVYDAKWFGLFQRVAKHRKEYETAAASPEFLAWISTTPAALSNPELRAWVAAQRAMNKARQAALAIATLEEATTSLSSVAGIVTAAASTTTTTSSAASVGSSKTPRRTENNEVLLEDRLILDDEEGATLEMEPLVQYLDTTTMISLPVVEAMDDDTIVTYADSITTSASTELNGPTATEEEDENGEPDNTML